MTPAGEEHVVYESGMVRGDDTGKPDYTLVDLALLERWAAHLTAQVPLKGRDNWRLARTPEDLQRFRASAFRHFIQWLRGDTDEDHAAAILFNIAGAEHVSAQLATPEKQPHGYPESQGGDVDSR